MSSFESWTGIRVERKLKEVTGITCRIESGQYPWSGKLATESATLAVTSVHSESDLSCMEFLIKCIPVIWSYLVISLILVSHDIRKMISYRILSCAIYRWESRPACLRQPWALNNVLRHRLAGFSHDAWSVLCVKNFHMLSC